MYGKMVFGPITPSNKPVCASRRAADTVLAPMVTGDERYLGRMDGCLPARKYILPCLTKNVKSPSQVCRASRYVNIPKPGNVVVYE